MPPEVLIVGAGPTGLVLALWLAKQGIALRIIDKGERPGEQSRAVAVQARVLEFYRQLGIADDVVAGGIRMEAILMRVEGRKIARAPLGDIGLGLSPFPYVLSYPQDDHERLLIAHLEWLGIRVERGTELTGFRQAGDTVRAELKTRHGTEIMEASYLCGCDGARSTVRLAMGEEFPGGTYAQVFFVADAMVTGDTPADTLQLCVSDKDFCLAFPVRSSGSFRLIGIVPMASEKKDPIVFEDVRAAAERDTGLKVGTLNWFSTYHIHHRMAPRFRKGRVFLLGDAAHIHSPAGGQGMNTGISDAVNLAWKLAAVLQNRAGAALLDSYEPERIAFAKRLLVTTDRMFQLMANRSRLGSFWRAVLLPRVFPFALRFRPVLRFMFRTISQIEVNYRGHPLSAGTAGRLQGGDRLPWVVLAEDGDNFEQLKTRDWQLHVYGMAGKPLQDAATAHALPLHVFPHGDAAQKAGLMKDALYLVRPDGYIALACPTQDTKRLKAFMTEFGIAMRA